MSEHHDSGTGHDDAHHVNYIKIYFILVALLVVSVAGPHLGIVWVTLITAFGVAIVKATLVVQNFMHLKWEKPIMKWMLATSLVLMGLFFFGTAPDVLEHEGVQWINVGAREAVARGIEAPHEAAAEHGDVAEHGEGAEGSDEASTDGGEAAGGQEFDAKAAYATVCATCHGANGDGNGPGGAALNPKPADFTDPAFWEGKTDEELVKAIREGGAAVGKSMLMPGWGALYNEAQTKVLVDYLKTFKK
ncbi:MAG: c-type cytochrome [Gemmatimonadota bacterium]